MAVARPAVTAMAAMLAALAVALWRGRPDRASDRLRPRSVAQPERRTASGNRFRRWRDASAADDPMALALAVDVVAGCLEAGVPLPAALDAGSAVAGPDAATALAATAAALRRGAEAGAWAACAADSRLAPVVRICRRAAGTGAAVAEDLRRAAAELRRARQAERRRRAQRAAVWVVLPLGLCFLPAFLLLTVVPVVAALLPGLR